MQDLDILLYGDVYENSVHQKIDYFQLMFPYGNARLITPLTINPRLLSADVLVIPGGADVDPARYDERPHYWTQRSNPHFEYLDKVFLPEWIKTGKPIIGICRGMQTLNVAMGGSLFQDIKGHQGHPNKREERHHDIYTEIYDPENKIDFRIYGTNSYHHQCVKRIADGFELIGWSHTLKHCPTTVKMYRDEVNHAKRWRKEEDILVEGKMTWKKDPTSFLAIPEIIRHKTLPYIGFQYHPENMNCKLFHHLVEPMLANL